MEIILKDETKKISFATDKTDNDNYVTLTMEVNGEEIEIDVLVTELLATAQAFMINKREKEESQEHYN